MFTSFLVNVLEITAGKKLSMPYCFRTIMYDNSKALQGGLSKGQANWFYRYLLYVTALLVLLEVQKKSFLFHE